MKIWLKSKAVISLAWVLAKYDLKIQNQRSLLGFVWRLVAPAISFGSLWYIFSKQLGQGIPQYPMYLLLGVILFGFFQRTSSSVLGAVQGSIGVIKSYNVPHEAFVVAFIFSSLFSHLFEILVLIGFLWFFQINFFNLIYYPIVLFCLTLLSLGVGLTISALQPFFPPLISLWRFFARILWLLTPIFYTIKDQPQLQTLSLFNPMYFIITAGRELIAYNRLPDAWILIGTIGYPLLVLIIGLLFFNMLKKYFTEIF